MARGLAAIDHANADGPTRVLVDGRECSKEQQHAERMTYWLGVIDPAAEPVQQLAARAAHLRRWVSPRSDHPDGRAGYLRWRSEHRRRQASEVEQLLREVGYDEAAARRVAVIVAKEQRATDPQVQSHEDALCLTFMELELDDLAARLGDDHIVGVLRRTAVKMSDAGLEATGQIHLTDHHQALLARALGPDPGLGAH